MHPIKYGVTERYIVLSLIRQQAMRNRLFLRWFSGYEQQKKYAIRSSEVKGEGRREYVALIVQRTHPQFEEIIQRFEEEIEMFNELKP